jgi:uncharacterized protein YjbI with pentapeptide repeats
LETLIGANLRGADLSDADLSDADLIGADLSDADLSGADLSGANLSGASLINANLSDASLSDANLSGANLSDAKMPLYCKWRFSIIENKKIKIGCKVKTIEEWESFFNGSETYLTKRNTGDFRQIQAVFMACKSYIEFLSK